MRIEVAIKKIQEAAENKSSELDLSSNDSEQKLTDTDIRELYEEIGKLGHLRKLDLSGNLISNVSFLNSLKKVKSVDLSNNHIHDLSGLRNTTLSSLSLRSNMIVDAGPLRQMVNLRFLDLLGNLLQVPEEILSDPSDAQKIRNFLDDYYSNKTRKLNEAKLVIVGEANVGKTCLVNRLIRNEFVTTSSTHGIRIEKWTDVVLENGERVQMNVWDFGGQEIMHSTHQFFFTKRTVYILVVNARENEDASKTQEWLQRIQNLSDDSPVFIVGNKIDENNRGTSPVNIGFFDIDKTNLLKKFPRLIKGFYAVSSDVGQKQYDFLFDEFRSSLINEIGKLKNIHDQFPASWMKIKSQLEDMKRDNVPYISFQDYLKRCEHEFIVKEQSKRTLIDFMHDLGIALSFQDDPELRNLAVLNPEWVTNGVYALIDNAQIALKKGILERSELQNYLDTTKYPPSTQDFIIKMMKKFKLLIEFNYYKFLIPDLLPKEEPDTGSWDKCLHFQYSYDIYEKSILRQFIVDMYEYCSSDTLWRNGIVLKFASNRALVKADPKEKTISIKVDGNINTRREVIGTIRIMFQAVHRTFSNLRFTEYVGHPRHPEILRKYERLLRMEADGIEKEYVDELRYHLIVKEWLDGFVKEDERKNRVESLAIAGERTDSDVEEQALSIKTKVGLDIGETVRDPTERAFLRTQAERVGKLKSRQLLAVTGFILVVTLGISIYLNFALVGVLLTIAIFAITYIVSHVRGKEWSFFKSTEQLISIEYDRLLDERGLPPDD